MTARPITAAPDSDDLWDATGSLFDDPAIQEPQTLAPLVEQFEDELVNKRGKIHYADDLDDFGDYLPAQQVKPWDYGRNQAAKTTWGGAKAQTTKAGVSSWRRGGWSSRGTRSYTSSYSTYDYSSYTRSSYSSWYSGYSSTKAAMRGVHRSASGFIRDSKRSSLSIYPSSSESLRPEALNLETGLHVRIDATLYEDLGIEKAQQHYTVDAIGQVLALQAMPNPEMACYLQNALGQLPRAIREVVTEVVRRRGLELLASEAPGWTSRIDAFRDAIALQDRPDDEGSSPHVARFDALMRAAWLPSDLSDPLAPQALELVLRLDDLLSAGGELRLADGLATDLRQFLSAGSDAMQAAVAIERILPTAENEVIKIQALCPEPPVPSEAADQIDAALEDIHQRVANLKIPSLLGKARSALRAGQMFLRRGPNAVPLQQIDALTIETYRARTQQMDLDRRCDAIRIDYEKQLRHKPGSHPVSSFLGQSALSILWAHASMDEPVLEVAADEMRARGIGATPPEDLQARIACLNALRAEYNTKTRELLASAQAADAVEGQLSALINQHAEDDTGNIPVWARFASSAGVQCVNDLHSLLKEIKNGSGPPAEDFRPRRKGEGEGKGGDLICSEGESRDDAEGRERRLAQNHADLIAEGAVAQEDLPQIGTDADLSSAPEIVIYDATNPELVAH